MAYGYLVNIFLYENSWKWEMDDFAKLRPNQTSWLFSDLPTPSFSKIVKFYEINLGYQSQTSVAKASIM